MTLALLILSALSSLILAVISFIHANNCYRYWQRELKAHARTREWAAELEQWVTNAQWKRSAGGIVEDWPEEIG